MSDGAVGASIVIFAPMFTDFSSEGRDEENRWFDTDHVPQRLTIPGFLSAARYERSAVTPAGASGVAPLRYINAYRITDPEAVQRAPYLDSYQHLTPRSASREYDVSAPVHRDVWTLFHRDERLRSDDGARVLLLTADEPGGSDDAAREFLRAEVAPRMLTLPGVLGVFQFERSDVAAPLNSGARAPRFLSAYVLAAPESAVRTELADREAAVADVATRSGDPVLREWSGVYDRRPRPWTVRPA